MSITRDEIRDIVAETLAEQKRVHKEDIQDDATTLKVIATILTSFGIDENDRLEIRADFVHLRKWRKSVEQAQGITFKAVFTMLATGVIAALLLGVKALVGK